MSASAAARKLSQADPCRSTTALALELGINCNTCSSRRAQLARSGGNLISFRGIPTVRAAPLADRPHKPGVRRASLGVTLAAFSGAR